MTVTQSPLPVGTHPVFNERRVYQSSPWGGAFAVSWGSDKVVVMEYPLGHLLVPG